MTKVIAHRGASGHALENTIAAFDLAVEMGADVLELDVRVTGDGDLAVIHDSTLARTAHDGRAVGQLDAAALAAIPLEVRPPLLDEVFVRYGSAVGYLIDIKRPSDTVERRVAEIVTAHGLEAHAEYQTYSRRTLRRLRRDGAGGSMALLYPTHLPAVMVRRDTGRVASFADAITAHAGSVDAGVVAAAHARGLRVEAYTVNEPAEIERVLALGIDGIVTDVPDRVRAAVDAHATVALVA